MDDFWLKRKINSTVAILIIFVLSTVVALYSLKAANEIVEMAPKSAAFNVEQRMTNEIDNYE